MTIRHSIFSKMTYTDVNSKRFIKIESYTILGLGEERRRLPSVFYLTSLQNFVILPNNNKSVNRLARKNFCN